MASGAESEVTEVSPLKRTKYALDTGFASKEPRDKTKGEGPRVTMGGALGPDWHSDIKMMGKASDEVSHTHWASHDHVTCTAFPLEILSRAR